MIQYGKQTIDQSDIDAVVEVLKENKYLTTGPRVTEFEDKLCQLTGAKYGIAVNSGTAALHLAVRALNLSPQDEIIVPAISFAATSNCVLYEGAIPVFCDIDPETLNIDVNKIESLITNNTKAIIFVDYAGQPPDYHSLRNLANLYNLVLIEDSAHSVGLKLTCCKRKNSNSTDPPYVGSYADLTTFSFHPVKNMTTGEGGMVMTNNQKYADHMRRFRNHGITTEYGSRRLHRYDITELGYNYRLTDLQCALGLSQLRRLPQWIDKRQEIALRYDEAFAPYSKLFRPLKVKTNCAYHIYVIFLNLENLQADRDKIFAKLKEENIGVNVHYKPIYLLTYYQNLDQNRYKTQKGLCPQAEDSYQRMITIPMYPTLTDQQIQKVINKVITTIKSYAK